MEATQPAHLLFTSWFDSGAVLAGFLVSLGLTLYVVTRNPWKDVGLLVNTVLVLATLASLPLTMMRIGLNIAVTDRIVLGYISIGGTLVVLLLGVSYLIRAWLVRRGGEAELSYEQRATPVEDLSGRGEPETRMRKILAEGGMSQAPFESAGKRTAWLRGVSGVMNGQTFPLSSNSMTIGRGANNTLVIDDPAVSRSHAIISCRDGEFFVEDAGSKTGTFVEGSSASRTRLRPGARLQFGDTEFVFMQDESSPTNRKTGNGSNATSSTKRIQGTETVVIQPDEGTISWLAFTSGPEKGKSYRLKVGNNSLGRDPDNDCVVNDRKVSRHHALINVSDSGIFLSDVGSQTGTSVGGHNLTGIVLQSGMSIKAGNTKLRFIATEKPDDMPDTMSGVTYVGSPDGGRGGVLIVESGADSGRSFHLNKGNNLVGRESDCEVQLSDATVSRHHTLISCVDSKCMVFDMGSKAGTRVDGEVIKGYNLTSGEVISVGDTQMVLMQADSQKVRG